MSDVTPIDTSADFFDALGSRTTETVQIEHEGRLYAFRIREMTVEQKARFEAALDQRKESKRQDALRRARVRAVQMCVLDAAGNPLFGTAEDAQKLASVGSAIITRLSNRILEISGFSEEDIERAEKNFEPIPSVRPSSAQPKLRASGT